MKEYVIEKQLSCGKMTVRMRRIGTDCHVILEGGERPHSGCAVLAVPRPSLSGGEQISSTASVLNVIGHKDEFLCRRLAEQVAAGQGRLTVCVGGFHTDHITKEQIWEVTEAADQAAAELSEMDWSSLR